ncbi:hypothetical protein [Blautia sp.]|uniref:hypothetical protein n=1 Tax=Blautia sp. TaxID=1955243 RepID=UPI003AB425C1
MNRFQKNSSRPMLRNFLYIFFFCGIICIFLSGLSSVSRITSSNEEESLKKSILQSAVHCYATQGFYPDSMDYLEENYGISYDKEKYLVSYEALGSNMMPDITVFSNNSKKGEN